MDGRMSGFTGKSGIYTAFPFICISMENALQLGNGVRSLYRVVEEVAIHLTANRALRLPYNPREN